MKAPYANQLIRLIIFAIILVLLGKYITDHWKDFSFISTIRWTILVPVVLLTLVSYLLETFRYFLVVREMETSVPFEDVFRHLIVARFLNKLVPQSGIVYRAHAFKKENAVSYSRFIASFTAFVWLDLVLTIIISTAIVALYQPNLSVQDYPLLPLLLAFSFLLLFITFLSRRIPTRMGSEIEANSNMSHSPKALYRLIGQIGFTFELARKPWLLLSGGLIIIANISVSVWRMFFLFQMIGVDAKISELALFVGLNRVSNVLVVTPGNLGIVEGSYGILSGAIGLGVAQGVTVALTLRVAAFIILGCLSAMLLFFQNQKKSGFLLKKKE